MAQWTHRWRLGFFSLAALFLPRLLEGQTSPVVPSVRLTPESEILSRVEAARPLRGGSLPADLPDRLGTTHYDGHYHLTDKPFLVEGADLIHQLGMRVAKFWLHEGDLPGYGYNSDWGKSREGDLVERLKHPYYVQALSHPFTTVLFEVFPQQGDKKSFFLGQKEFSAEEKQIYEVGKYLLETYRNRPVRFILQNWEGDWMLRHSEGGNWGQVPKEEVDRRCEAFVKFVEARQRGVERARQEVPDSQAKVYHAVEVNRVWDGMEGIATLSTRVLPKVKVDLVSWSCYDGLESPVKTWQGIEILRQSMQPSPTFGTNAVYVGEVGLPENGLEKGKVIDFWDRTMGVFLAMDLPFVVHWELYCNEPKDGTKEQRHPRRAEEMKGFWWVKPDGKPGFGGEYLNALLEHAGRTLPPEVREALAPSQIPPAGSGADSAEVRKKVAWLWDFFRDNPVQEEKETEMTRLYGQLNREDLEASDAQGTEIMGRLASSDPGKAARLQALWGRVHAERLQAIRAKKPSLDDSTDARAKLCFLMDHFRENPVVASKVPSMVELYALLLEDDRLAVDQRAEKVLLEKAAFPSSGAEELQAALAQMRKGVE
jgi:hypothetical protein